MDLLNLPNVSFREFVHRPDMDSRCAYRPARPAESLSFRHSYYPLTLQCAPSESTNCASKPPKSCFVGGILNRTPFAFISWWNLSRSGTLKPSSTAPARFFWDAGCNARIVSPVTNSLQPDEWNFRGKPSTSR